MTIRIDFYNEIAKLLCYYKEKPTFEYELNEEETLALEYMLDILGRTHYGPPCSKTVDAFYQNELSKGINPDAPEEHDGCPCVRSEKHNGFHRCKHGYFTT